ncbi:helix-turn-helix domain-containing protein [Trichococcus pasteurii]|uniref:Bacteriophage r1t orf18 n=1 Tax=Trichococcus pasteurii TaxID=43064 RepID=A0A1W1ICX0_9LACT|nr:helix-turn-helix domain-containing protein [Trichococcus pasteurii]SFE36808.1 Helix-turn-helix domain-containing protein [Trichococcus pasteurii]SLM50878.1 bacteriophage r1t orf18 [Trichococcus pasteurii]SSB91759.1 bacteriophage r1t orf18 [Trichococcus pasteurii]
MAELRVKIDDAFNDEFKAMLRSAAKEVVEEVISQETRLKDWVTVKEIQEYFDVSPNTVAAWIRSGLAVSTVGQKRFVSKANLSKFLADHEK